MYYYLCTTTHDEDTVFVQSEKKAAIGDLVVYMNYSCPDLAKVEKEIDELTAITGDYCFAEAISVIGMKAYLEKRAKEIQKAKLIRQMREQMDIAKLQETLRKNSECTAEMSSLYASYKALCGDTE